LKGLKYEKNSTEGCKPMMELKNKVPKDLDYDKYIELCYNYLEDLGYEG